MPQVRCRACVSLDCVGMGVERAAAAGHSARFQPLHTFSQLAPSPRRCYAAAPGATCFHKSQASAAALCFFDSRAERGMVARYATHHRSLYPHLELVREHFLLTSHAGVPVAVWDRRCVVHAGWDC